MDNKSTTTNKLAPDGFIFKSGIFKPPGGLSVQQCLLLAFVTVPFLLTLPANSLLRKSLYPLHIYIIICTFFADKPAHAPSSELYSLGLLVGTWTARIIDRVYMHAPEKCFKRKGIDDQPGKSLEGYSPIKKFFWAAELMSAARGIGWNWEVGGIPPSKVQSRRSFVVERIKKTTITFAGIYATAELAKLILTDDEELRSRGFATVLPLLRNSIFLRVFTTAGWLTVVYGHIVLPENLVAVLLVGSGIGGRRWADPASWPPAFGEITDAYSLRRFWGKFWHAALRRSTNAPGNWLVSQIHQLQRPKSQVARVVKRYFLLGLAFFVSALIHACGSYMVTRDWPSGPSDGGAFLYFLSQPVAIAVEDFACHLLGIKDGNQPSVPRRLIGYSLVAAFWLYAFPSLKVNPLAAAHGIRDGRGSMMEGVKACELLAEAIPVNPVKSVAEFLRQRVR